MSLMKGGIPNRLLFINKGKIVKKRLVTIMKQKLVYEPGHRYGPYNLLLVKRSDRVNSYGKHKYGWYECLDCSKLFEATNYNVKIGQAIRCSECRKK